MFAVVYTKPNCQPCKATKRHLTALGATWAELPIDPEQVPLWASQGFKTAPIVEVYEKDEDGDTELVERWSGFKPSKLRDYFERRTIEDLKKEIGLA